MNALSLFAVADVTLLERLTGWVEFGVSAVVILAMLIVAHEFGHFISARLVGVRVERFSVGFGRKIYGRKYGDTEYMVSLVPLGGYVKFYGDDPDSDEVDNEEDSFLNQPVWKRLIIVAAGPFFNIALAILIVALAAMYGMPSGSRVIDEVTEKSPAQTAGFIPGDRIESINGEAIETWTQIQETVRDAPGEKLTVGILRETTGERMEVVVIPEEKTVKTIDGKDMVIGLIGVAPRQITVSYPPHEAIIKGFEWTWRITSLTIWSISKLITREIPADQIAGPVGIMHMAGQAAESGFVNLLMFIGLISVNLGILNLLPIPVLDGGHLLFFTIEAALGKPLKLRHQEIAQQIGIFMLISLMALAFYNDIVRLVSG